MSLTIEKQEAKRIYVESPDWFKLKLVEAFGEECFKEKGFESIKTFEDACAVLGINPGLVFNRADTPDEFAYKKLKVIIKAINEGWIPDWSNRDQYKYYPWFEVLSSGFGFSDSDYDYASTFTAVGSRLCFESREKSDYAAKQFIDIYKSFLL